jgi:hypothetical protein
MQNKGVKAGTVRVGAKGKTVRTYNAKTGRWDVTKASVKSYGAALGQKKRPITKTTQTKVNPYSQYVSASKRPGPRTTLPESSMNPLAYQRRVDALKKSISNQNTRINIGDAQASTRAKQKSELDRLKKELAQLQQQNKK